MPEEMLTRHIVLALYAIGLAAVMVWMVRRTSAPEAVPVRVRIVKSATVAGWVATIVADAAGWIAQ